MSRRRDLPTVPSYRIQVRARATPQGSNEGELSLEQAIVRKISRHDEVAPIPATIRRIQAEFDWNSALPPRAVTRRWRIERGIKRILDVAIALAMLVLLSPFLLLVALLVRLTSRGPALFEWRVLGERAQPFVGYKFRTMVVNAEALKSDYLDLNEMTGPVFKMRNDPRVTPIGRFLRKYSIDEVPQLWNVIKGEMTLVGPRPPYAHEYAAFDPRHWGKLAVRPGLTCTWQVMGRSTIANFDEWAHLDLAYIRDWSLWLDLKLLLQTIPAVLRGHGAF
jgi:lipopolysaccharide/colanic/teichoic acid biosynthesis glycosyltransferase